MTKQVYSVAIFSPEGRASDVLPIEVDLETAVAVATCFFRITHLQFHVVCRSTWEYVPEAVWGSSTPMAKETET